MSGTGPGPDEPGWAAPPPAGGAAPRPPDSGWSPPPPGQIPPPAPGTGWSPPPTPPAAGPPPGAWPPPPPRTRKRGRWLLVLVPLLVVFGIGAALLVVEFVEFLGEPVDATNEYLADLRAGRYEEAYGSLCTVTRLALSESDFVAQQQTDEQELGRITSYDITTSDVEGDGAATTRGEVVRGGRTFDYRFDLREEQDRWRMCSWSGPSAGD